jgi:hypothetical protein
MGQGRNRRRINPGNAYRRLTGKGMKARRIVEEAIGRLPGAPDRQVWTDWRSGAKQADSALTANADVPADVARLAARAVAMFASESEGDLRAREGDDTELGQLGNLLAEMRSVERTLTQRALA